MKKSLLLILLTGLLLPGIAQEFAPVGAEWHWDERFAFSGNIDYIKFQSEKDTTILGESCRKITKRHPLLCNMRPEVEFVFDRNDTVFFYDEIFNTFQILYDFNAETNDSWVILFVDETNDADSLIITVDSTSTMIVNDEELKVLYVTYFKNDEYMPETYYSRIIEKFGDMIYMFNWQPLSMVACDGNISFGLRCYEDNEFGFYSTGLADSCDYVYIWTGIENSLNENDISIYPNPAIEQITIEVPDKTNLQVKITDITGNLIIHEKFTESVNIGISGYASGVYLVSIYKNDKIIGRNKILKNN